jgi:hypothetical protein
MASRTFIFSLVPLPAAPKSTCNSRRSSPIVPNSSITREETDLVFVRSLLFSSKSSAASILRSRCGSERVTPEWNTQGLPAATSQMGHGTVSNSAGVTFFILIPTGYGPTPPGTDQIGTSAPHRPAHPEPDHRASAQKKSTCCCVSNSTVLTLGAAKRIYGMAWGRPNMDSHFICSNPGCRFILDRRVNGASLDGVRKIVNQCPECGSDWVSACPFCERTLTVEFIKGLPHSRCCGRKLRAEVLAA